MGFEPNARNRLLLVRATSDDPALIHVLGTTLEDHGMSFVPSAELLRQVTACADCITPASSVPVRDDLCATHRSRWNLELCSPPPRDEGDVALEQIMRDVLASESGARQLLTALDRQLRALSLVWEAHERGAVRLPERIAESVRSARLNVPTALPGGGARIIKQAS
jgi:hypothetical protein